ncbi:MAG: MBOAT family O-acyltransferase [Flavobacteriales bacterium]|tara:strand:+ start:33 stop:1451 length:1419 start_codon:yes stop_codon:yes gene_type:complete
MLFNSIVFFIFLAIILPIYYILPRKTQRNSFLLVVSYVFYGYWDWTFCTLLATSTIVDYFLGIHIERSKTPTKRKLLLIASLTVNLGILGFFKYFNFFADSFGVMVEQFGYTPDYLHLNIILPVGISFYTFQTLSYSIDIYRGNLKPTKNFIDFALFVAFFPQLVAGPIEKARDLLPQLSSKRIPTRKQLSEGVILVVTGLFRKVMIGDVCGRYVDNILNDMNYYRSSELLFAMFLFSIQIYADFSGYSKMARGCAKLLGFELSINFSQPYLATNITDFWRRWHISLSSWLKEYLYFALGGNRNGATRTKINLFITMLLGGLWHGAGVNFIIWGGLHGLYLSIHKWYNSGKDLNKPKSSNVLVKALKIITTLFFVQLAWIFFRLPDLNHVSIFFDKIIHWEASELTPKLLSISLAFSLMVLTLDISEYKLKSDTFLIKLHPINRYGILSILFIVSILFIYQVKALPFIYFQF